MTQTEFAYFLAHKRSNDPRFDASDLDERFVPYLRSGQRIKVEVYGRTITGTVGITTGWKPVFLLMRTSRSIGSSDILDKRAKLLAVKVGREYRGLK